MKKSIVNLILNSCKTAELLPSYCRVVKNDVLDYNYSLGKYCDYNEVVRMKGLEPSHREAPDPKFFLLQQANLITNSIKTTLETVLSYFYTYKLHKNTNNKAISILCKSMYFNDYLVKFTAELLPSLLSAVTWLFLCLFSLCECLILNLFPKKVKLYPFDLDTHISRNFNRRNKKC